MTNAFALSGRCTYNSDDDRLVCDVNATGAKTGDLHYARSGRQRMLTGTFDGKPVLLTQDDVQGG